MTDPQIAEIARKLTAAQKSVLRMAEQTADGRWLVWSANETGAGPWPKSVARYYSHSLDCLTDFGQSVAAYLKEQSSHG